MGRAKVEVDRELVQRVMRKYSLASEQEAIDFALERVDEWVQFPAVEPLSKEELLATRGSGWSGDLDEIRPGRRLSRHD